MSVSSVSVQDPFTVHVRRADINFPEKHLSRERRYLLSTLCVHLFRFFNFNGTFIHGMSKINNVFSPVISNVPLSIIRNWLFWQATVNILIFVNFLVNYSNCKFKKNYTRGTLFVMFLTPLQNFSSIGSVYFEKTDGERSLQQYVKIVSRFSRKIIRQLSCNFLETSKML